jgi:peptidyl-dipeptidase A
MTFFFLDYADYGEYWRDSYEDENFIENVDEMWKQVKPLYNELHTFVRRKLQKMYSDKMDKNSEMIPAHLLGNMWYVVLLKIVNLISIDLSCIFFKGAIMG